MKTLVWTLLAVAALVALLLWFRSRELNAATPATSAPGANAESAAKPATPADVDAFLAPARAALDASRRPVRRIELVPLPLDALAVSKVGGRAWWPEGTPAPTGSAGEPMVLLAQVNFAEVPPIEGYPTQGLLQFFVAARDDVYGATFSDGATTMESLATQQRFRIVYWTDLTVPSIALPVPADTLTPHTPDKPRGMRFVSDEEALSLHDYRFDRLYDGNAYAAAEAAAAARGIDVDQLLDGVWDRHGGTGHKLGGYPHFTQTDPRDGGDWELLLQLDTDDEMMWGDVGVGNFFIQPADLARGDFSRVAYNWDCH
jgi:uncharacterized protein YwqG